MASKKRMHLREKALFHFAFFFAMGFFSGFTSRSTSSPPRHHHPRPAPRILTGDGEARSVPGRNPSPIPQQPGVSHSAQFPPLDADITDDDRPESNPARLIITVTTGPHLLKADLLRLAATLRLVRPPLLWLVVGGNASASDEIARALRGTAVMHRHLTYKENFTDAEKEVHYRRNVALGHIERHRLSGIVHFAGAGAAYDLQFFEEIRQIETFGIWPVATLLAGGAKSFVLIEGPFCKGHQVLGWFSRELGNGSTAAVTYAHEFDLGSRSTTQSHDINISGFAFNSSILWDPERWGRPASLPDTSQDSMKFINDMILEDRAKLKGIPSDCSQIMLWHRQIPRVLLAHSPQTKPE